MQAILNATSLALLVIIYSAVFVRDVVRYGPTFRAGLCFGTIHLILIPLVACAVTSRLEVDPEFRAATILPDLVWTQDAAAITIIMFPLMTMLFAFPFLRRQSDRPIPYPDQWKWWLTIYAAVAIFSFVAAGLTQEGAHWYQSREIFAEENGLAAVIILYVQAALQLLTVGCLFHGALTRQISYKSVALGAIVISVIDLYTTGNRIWIVFMLACIVVVLIRNRKTLVLLGLGVLLVPFGFFMTIFRWMRAYMHLSSDRSLSGIFASLGDGYQFAQQRLSAEGFGISEFVYGVTEAIDMNVYHAAVITFGDQRALLWGNTLLKAFVFWVPRSIWADKPDSITLVAAEVFAPNVQGLSLVTTFFGELYMNFGLWFVIAVPLVVVLVGRLLDLGVRRIPFSGMLLFVIGIAIIRFPLSDFLLNVIIAIALYAGGTHLAQFLRGGAQLPSRRLKRSGSI